MRAWLLVLALQLITTAALAQVTGDPAAGRRLAEAQCSSCHAIGPGPRGSEAGAAPAFADVARMPSTTALALQAFLRTPHAGMPDIALTPAQLDDVVALILSLR